MKLWEVIKELTDDPTKVFEGNLGSEDWVFRMRVEKGVSRYFHFEVLDGGEVIDQSLPAGGFNGNVALDFDWYEVSQPVTWREAIQEFAKGKKLNIKFNNQEWTLGELVELPKYLDGAITSGKWYVE